MHTLKLMTAHTDDGLIRASKVYTAVGSRKLHLHYRQKGYASHIAKSPGDRTLFVKASSTSPIEKKSKDKMDHAGCLASSTESSGGPRDAMCAARRVPEWY